MQEGKCPKCASNKIDYTGDAPDMNGDEVGFPCKCKNCGWHGYAWHSLEFQEYVEDEE